ncbi:MAG TPA: hypothetical protein DCS23_00745 [Candidatus Yonathbacteria bacterium]|nr:hypothetical protein [Candidatus Yonathbacteria bacterium]
MSLLTAHHLSKFIFLYYTISTEKSKRKRYAQNIHRIKGLPPISHPNRTAEFLGKKQAGARIISRYYEGEAKVF